MIELKERRKYNQKTIIDDDGKTKVRIFTGPVHYFNKLKIGDGIEGWRDQDNTLQWNENNRTWGFLFNNFIPRIPEYADDWFYYRDIWQGKDQTFAFRPRNAAHVTGQIVGNDVIYTDAFGTGFDLVIRFTRNSMQKLVRIREGFYPAVDTEFDFILKFPDGVGVYENVGDEMKTLDPLQPKTLGLKSEIYIGTDKNDGKDWYTKLRPIKIWDSGVVGTNNKAQFIGAAIVVVGGATVLRKRVPASFFTNATGDVYTDTTINYTTTDDTYYGSSFNPGPNGTSTTLGFGGWGDNYYDYFKFDITDAPEADQASAVTINVYTAAGSTNDAVIQAREVTSYWTGSTLTRTNAPSEITTNRGSLSSTVGAGWKNATITGLYTDWKNGIVTNHGVKLHPTVTNNANNGNFDSVENGSGNAPYIQVTLAYEIEQEGYRWRDDNGSETTASWLVSQDNNITRAKNANTRLRVIINATGDPPSKGYQVEYRVQGSSDPWKKIE